MIIYIGVKEVYRVFFFFIKYFLKTIVVTIIYQFFIKTFKKIKMLAEGSWLRGNAVPALQFGNWMNERERGEGRKWIG